MDLAVDSASQETVAYWDGFRLVSEDRRKIARFARNGFAFSQIAPYGNWERFASEAKRLWGIFVAHANPVQVERLGVRFINRVSRVSIESLDRVLRFPPPNLDRPSLPLEEFLNRSLYKVPGHPFRVNVTQTTQPVLSSDENAPALIVDIDVFMTATIEPMSSSLDDRLEEMRWLKNKVFFSVFSDEAINRFSGIDK